MLVAVQELYHRYLIPPWLRLHQFRVAAVGKWLAEQLIPDEQNEVVSACLLHDMGNILKMDFDNHLIELTAQQREYWLEVQQTMQSKYGQNPDQMTLQILHELRVSERLLSLVKAVGFSNIIDTIDSNDLAKRICEYADLRVAPGGIVTLSERLHDLRSRYHGEFHSNFEKNQRLFADQVVELEQGLEDKLDQSIDNLMKLTDQDVDKLREFEIEVEVT